MKKRNIFISCLLLVGVMLFALCGCSAYGGIKSAFEKEGYSETETSEELEQRYKDDETYRKIADVVTLHVMQKQSDGEGLGSLFDRANFAVIAEFHSNEDMENALKDLVSAEDAKNIYDELQKLPVVNGNCFLLFATSMDAQTIFKNAK